MNTKTTLLVAILAVAVAAVLFFVVKPWETPAPVEKPKTTAKDLFDPKPADVDRVEVTVRDSDQPKRVFVKDGDGWAMLEPIKCPANDYQVKDDIVKKVTDLKYLREYAPGDKALPKDGVTRLSEPAATVKLMKADKPLAELIVGNDLAIGKGTYVKRGGSDKVYETQDSIGKQFAKKIADYRNKRVLSFKLADVKDLTVSGRSNYKLAKSGDDWMIEQPDRGRASKSEAEGVINQLTSLYAQDFIEDAPTSYKSYGLDKPRLTVTVNATQTVPAKVKAGEPFTQPADTQPSSEPVQYVLSIGGSAGDNNFFAKLNSAPWVFTVQQYMVDKLASDVSTLREKAVATIQTARVTKVASHTPDGDMTLARKDGKWSFADGAVCDSSAVDDLVKAINDLKASEFVDTGKLLAPLDWKKPRARVTITQEGTANPITVLVGPQSPSGKMVYVRNEAEDAVAVVREDQVAQLLAGPVAYSDRQIIQFPRERATRLEITRAGGETVALTHKNNLWSMAEPVQARADAEAVRNLLQDLASLRAKRVVGSGNKADYGLDSPAVRLAVWVEPLTADPKTVVAQSKPASAPAGTQPASTQPAKKKITTQDLLDYTLSLPKESSDPKVITQNPLAVKMLQDMIAKEKAAATQPAQSKPADPVADRLIAELTAQKQAASQPATQPAPKPTIYRFLLAQRDGKTYACREDSATIFELENKIYDDANAEMHERQMAKVDPATASELMLAVGGTELTFRKSGDNWVYAADSVLPIDKEKVTEVLNAVRDLKTHRYVSYEAADLAKYGLAGQVDRVAVAVEGGKRIEFLLSASGPAGDPDKSRYAALAGTKAVFLLKGDQVEKFAKKLDSFEQTAKEPAPGGRPSPGMPPMGGGGMEPDER